MRKKTRRSKDGDIQRDSAGLEGGLGDLHPDDGDEAVLENEDMVYKNGDDFKTMINRFIS
jgi:hypothetical protein